MFYKVLYFYSVINNNYRTFIKNKIMKKLFFTAMIAVSVVSSAFASDVKKVNYRVLHAFEQQYRGASNVEWTSKPEFVKATFTQDNAKVDVFYNYNGDKIGASKSVEAD